MTRCCGNSAGVRQSLPALFARLPYSRSLQAIRVRQMRVASRKECKDWDCGASMFDEMSPRQKLEQRSGPMEGIWSSPAQGAASAAAIVHDAV